MENNILEKLARELIVSIDSDNQREGLKDTPRRYVKAMQELTTPPEFAPTTFSSEGYDEMIIQSNIPFYSLCEHHLLPFFGVGSIAYIPDGKIIGLSKLARMLEHFSRRLQNQERITMQVADSLMHAAQPKGVGVIISARHFCMEMRGVKKYGSSTTTSTLRGTFKTNSRTRAEFLSLVSREV